MYRRVAAVSRTKKTLSYRRDRAVQDALVLAKSGRLEQILGDNILRTLWVYLQPL